MATMNESLQQVWRPLCAAVQRNCHISDARYAGDYSLCIYLLKMREYYRWERRLGLTVKLSQQAVGDWVAQREDMWRQLEQDDIAPLKIGGRQFDAFDDEGINGELLPHGLVYSGGHGRFGKPHFFLARVLQTENFRGYTVIVCGEEYARDLTAPPAMTRGRLIFVRRESLRRMVWEKIEEWRWKKLNNAMTLALASYDIERNLEAALEQITDNEVETLIFHEVGEVIASELLGDSWQEMLRRVARTPGEITARAVRDQLADCLSTLPALLELESLASIHFYFASLTGMRKQLCPSLARAYQCWVESGDLAELKRSVPNGRRQWLSVANNLLELHRQHGDRCAPYVAAVAEHCRL
jgi:Family of unknown function (DUF6866) C-terminal domain/Family of unknown function (DUF6866) N-terminal domain